MPTYTVHTVSGRLTNADRSGLAKSLAAAHSAATGASGVFAQVFFSEIPHGHWYVGGGIAPNDQVFVYGRIRAGRTAEQKGALIESLADAVVNKCGISRTRVWVYLLDVPADSMIEYGRVLPPPGGEEEWLAALPADAVPARPTHGQ